MKVTSSIEEYVAQQSHIYYMSPGFVPDIFTDTFVHVNRCSITEVSGIISQEESKGYLVNASPLRLSIYHAVLSYKRARPEPCSEEFKKKVGTAGAHLANIITR